MKNWTAYCITCHKVLEDCPNGEFAEVAARIHVDDKPYHKVIVGYVQDVPKRQTKREARLAAILSA